MAIASVGTLGSANSKTANQASATLTTSSALAAGNVGVLVVAVDNNQATDGDEGAVTGVTDSGGNTWTKGAEFTNGNGSIQAGCVCSVWFSNSVNGVANGGTITAAFSNATSRDASAMSAWEFSKAANSNLAVEGTPGTLANDAADPGSLNVTTANIECLRFRGIAGETSATGAITTTAGWTAITGDQSAGGASDTNIAVRGEFIISTVTGSASDPTLGIADHASVYVAFKEVLNSIPNALMLMGYGG